MLRSVIKPPIESIVKSIVPAGQDGGPSPAVSREIDEANLAAAYSLSRLRDGYGGSPTEPAIRVRESNGNTEANIGFDGIGLDTTALLAHCGSFDGFITKWYDQSGNGYDLLQVSNTRQFKIVDGGDVLLFGGNDKPTFLLANNALYYTLTSTNFSQPITMFAAIKWDKTGSGSTSGRIISSESPLFQDIFDPTVDRLTIQAPTSLNVDFAFEDDRLVCELYNTTSSQVWINGNSAGTGNVGTNVLNLYFVGNASCYCRPLRGNMTELLFYNADKTSQRTAIETNINDYYSIYS